MTAAAGLPEAAAFTARIAALEAAADWPGLAEAFESGARAWRTPRTVLAYVYAAVALNDPARRSRIC